MYLSLQEASRVLGLKYNWLRSQCVKGTIPCMRTSEKGKWMVDPSAVKKCIDKKADGGKEAA